MTEPLTKEFPRRKIRALIVDDQLIQREILRRMLRNESDIEIVGAPENGREAVESINRLRPDVVFMDVLMPGLDGLEAVSEISPERRPAVIFVSANEQFKEQATKLNALDYILKPCSRDRFQTALQRIRALFQMPCGEAHA